HNSLIVAAGGTAHVVAQPAPDDPDGAQHWTVQPTIDGSRLYLTAAHIHEQPGGSLQQLGTALAEFTLPAGADPLVVRDVGTPSSGRTTDRRPQWGAAFTRTGLYTYIWGQADPGDSFGARDTYLARVTAGSLTNLARWEYWAGTGWVADEAAARPVMTAASNGG